jgi:site-specific DNA recombinase
VAELDRRKIVTKRRHTKVAKYQGGIPFTYGPLAYFLKNRIYVGEVHHAGKWFEGEHKAILDRQTFERVQELLKSNSNGRRGKSSKTGAPLLGKLYDDKGNLMGPSFSTKNGVRYRFYVSRALLRGRKAGAGSVSRVASSLIETVVVDALRNQLSSDSSLDDATLLDHHLSKVELGAKQVILRYHPDARHPDSEEADRSVASQIELPWTVKSRSLPSSSESQMAEGSDQPDPKAVQAIARARSWAAALESRRYASVEELAKSVKLHPKVVRGELRFAFLSPNIVESALNGDHGLTLRNLRKVESLNWRTQHAELYEG